jgi:hypothetical protein
MENKKKGLEDGFKECRDETFEKGRYQSFQNGIKKGKIGAWKETAVKICAN